MDANRRRFIGLTGAALTTGLAGCSGGGEETEAGTPAADSTDTGSPIGTQTETEADTSYTVNMAPVGDVTFDEPPENVAHYFPGYGDMVVALGHGDTINSMGLLSRYHTDHYDELDGVSLDKSKLTQLIGDAGIDKEIFYELESDLHMIDPQWLVNNGFFKLDESDIEELTENVAPFFGNLIFRRTDQWHDYRYYSMYEAFEKVAQVHQEEEKYAEIKSFHDEYIAEVQTNLPSADSRPNALLCFAGGNEPEAFYPYRLSDKGANKKQFHDLGITDALAETGIEGLSTTDRGQIDYETMLEVDPDSILMRGHEGKSREEFQNTVVSFMKNHDVASDLTAVQNDMVFRGGPIYPGPLHNFFLTERYATLYFPDQFSGELFSRSELSTIVTSE
jgi:iron complex transport system substrate-binding protein